MTIDTKKLRILAKVARIRTITESEMLSMFVAADSIEMQAAKISGLDAEIDRLRETLQALYDVQNGPPLEKYRDDWEAVMGKVVNILREVNHDNQ